MTTRYKITLALLAGTLAASNARAQLFADESFSYSNGTLTTVSSDAWAAHSGAGVIPVQVVDGAAVLNQGSGSREDVNIALGQTMVPGDIWYYSMDVTVTGGNTAVYFAMLMETASLFNARLWVSPSEGSDFTFAISDGSAIDATWGSGLTFGNTYKVVVAYDYDDGDSTLWVNPTSEASPSVTFNGGLSDDITSFGLRQAGGNSSQVVDNLRVGDTFAAVAVPEPHEYGLMFGGVLGAFALWRRRARR